MVQKAAQGSFSGNRPWKMRKYPKLTELQCAVWDHSGVLQAFDEKHTQSTMDNFLNFSQRFAKIKSKRLQKAVSAIRGSKNEEILLADIPEEQTPRKKGKKRKAADVSVPGVCPLSMLHLFLQCIHACRKLGVKTSL